MLVNADYKVLQYFEEKKIIRKLIPGLILSFRDVMTITLSIVPRIVLTIILVVAAVEVNSRIFIGVILSLLVFVI